MNPAISPAFFQALMDPETRNSILKEAKLKAVEKEWRNVLKDRKNFYGVILQLETNRKIVGLANGSTNVPETIDETPIFYKAFLRVEGVHDKSLPHPCEFDDPNIQKFVIGLHSPPAISKMIAPDMAARFNLKPGMRVHCQWNPGPAHEGKQRNFTFEPASAGKADESKDPCLRGRISRIKNSFNKSPKLHTKKTTPKPKKKPEAKVTNNKIEISENILFEFDQATILEESYSIITEVANKLKQNTAIKIRIEGHTDNLGSDSYNQRLSKRRAKAVYDRLVSEEKISSSRMSHKGIGEKRPIATNDTDEGRQKNRRVEFIIVSEN
jgi:outer membrane protein OmpA-like peptidoglycan-associated protein